MGRFLALPASHIEMGLTGSTKLLHTPWFDVSKHWRVVVNIHNLNPYVNFFLCMAAVFVLSDT